MNNLPEWITNNDRADYFHMATAHIHYIDKKTFNEIVAKKTTRCDSTDGNFILLSNNNECYIFIKM